MQPPNYPRPGAWADDPVHAQTLCEVLHRGAPEQLADLEREALHTVGAQGEASFQVFSEGAAEEVAEYGYERGYKAGYKAAKRETQEAS